jgi:hypothetical protein
VIHEITQSDDEKENFHPIDIKKSKSFVGVINNIKKSTSYVALIQNIKKSSSFVVAKAKGITTSITERYGMAGYKSYLFGTILLLAFMLLSNRKALLRHILYRKNKLLK